MSNKYYQDSNASMFPTIAGEQVQNQVQGSYTSCDSPVINQPNYSACDFIYGQQMVIRNPVNYTANSYFCADQIDNTAWLPDPKVFADIEKGLKLSDKIETIEITSKDLSPASCCSNVDLLLPDLYKSINRDINYFGKSVTNDSQWFCNVNCNNKIHSYLPCSQGVDNEFENKQPKYCSMQKLPEFENVKVLSFNNNQQTEQYLQSCSKEKLYFTEEVNQNNINDYNIYNTCDNRKDDALLSLSDINTNIFYSNIPFEDINEDHNSVNCSNGESDIVVEESDEETPDICENISKKCDYSTNCIICNCMFTPTGNQFFILTTETPLTMCSQISVHQKLSEVVELVENKHNYLCNQCLDLINTIDHLQWKLENTRVELIKKYEKTCQFNGINLNANKKVENKTKKLFKNFCGRHSFKCKECKKVFTLKKLYWSHLCRKKTHKYLCEMCGKTIKSYKFFNRHLLLHKNVIKRFQPSIQLFKCKICEKLFRTNTRLKEHLNYCSGKFPYVCEHEGCDKKFATSTKLKNHVKQKHDKKFIAICSICNIGFVIISDYKTHMVSHSTEKKYNCAKCHKSYKTLSNLNFHMKVHSETMPFTCTICKKGFMRKEYLESHVNNHYGIKNYACAICNKKFVSQKNLDVHSKHHDGSVKTKTCNICGKNVANGLEDHLRTHMNLLEFECNVCKMKFNTKNTLSKHVKKKHCN
ncbi:zinc finger protein 155-like [Agrilus planipennis]|uniref:Zinc finger protein 155-like n=1 Tax=Agrilus planipennis TaxID=224129 RepID=A0A1W4WLC6_AGRPL|nr:zinc finger protein 155-like [Agrilus planipennis]